MFLELKGCVLPTKPDTTACVCVCVLQLNVKMGRALRPGEHRVKVYQLDVNDAEPTKFLLETIFAKGMTVLESKELILPEIKEKCGIDVPVERWVGALLLCG